MKYTEYTLTDIKNFDLKETFECGQCFRWKKEENGSYTGIVECGVINASIINDKVVFKGTCKDDVDFESFCRNYFDLEEDYNKIQKSILKEDDKTLKKAVEFGKGIRILNQNSWEMLISFIISAANNIPRISKTIDNISSSFGKCVRSDVSGIMKEYFLFPTPDELSKATMEDLRKCNLGFRDKYVFEATRKVFLEEVNLDNIKKMDYKNAKKELLCISGVGSKVADCILLFSMCKKEAFPVDTWIKQIMNKVYVDSKNVKKIEEYAQNRFGIFSGVAQQYLFYYARENIDF